MVAARILFLLVIIPAAHAQLPEVRPSSADSDVLLNLPYTMRLELGLAPLSVSPVRGPSQVFTDDYWSRAYEERAQLQSRFGIRLADASSLRPYLVQQTPVPGHPNFGFVQELRWPGSSPLTGLQFERRDFLLSGDRLSIRATSDIQTLMRGTGLSGSETEVELLSLLGWRSHSRLVWQLGEPTHELRWQLSAGMDRRAATQSSTVDLEVMRRF
jgi:hypothetical protein